MGDAQKVIHPSVASNVECTQIGRVMEVVTTEERTRPMYMVSSIKPSPPKDERHKVSNIQIRHMRAYGSAL